MINVFSEIKSTDLICQFNTCFMFLYTILSVFTNCVCCSYILLHTWKESVRLNVPAIKDPFVQRNILKCVVFAKHQCHINHHYTPTYWIVFIVFMIGPSAKLDSSYHFVLPKTRILKNTRTIALH